MAYPRNTQKNNANFFDSISDCRSSWNRKYDRHILHPAFHNRRIVLMEMSQADNCTILLSFCSLDNSPFAFAQEMYVFKDQIYTTHQMEHCARAIGFFCHSRTCVKWKLEPCRIYTQRSLISFVLRKKEKPNWTRVSEAQKHTWATDYVLAIRLTRSITAFCLAWDRIESCKRWVFALLFYHWNFTKVFVSGEMVITKKLCKMKYALLTTQSFLIISKINRAIFTKIKLNFGLRIYRLSSYLFKE